MFMIGCSQSLIRQDVWSEFDGETLTSPDEIQQILLRDLGILDVI